MATKDYVHFEMSNLAYAGWFCACYAIFMLTAYIAGIVNPTGIQLSSQTWGWYKNASLWGSVAFSIALILMYSGGIGADIVTFLIGGFFASLLTAFTLYLQYHIFQYNVSTPGHCAAAYAQAAMMMSLIGYGIFEMGAISKGEAGPTGVERGTHLFMFVTLSFIMIVGMGVVMGIIANKSSPEGAIVSIHFEGLDTKTLKDVLTLKLWGMVFGSWAFSIVLILTIGYITGLDLRVGRWFSFSFLGTIIALFMVSAPMVNIPNFSLNGVGFFSTYIYVGLLAYLAATTLAELGIVRQKEALEVTTPKER